MTAAVFAITAATFVAGWLLVKALNWADARWWAGPAESAVHDARMAAMEAADEHAVRGWGCSHDRSWCCDACWKASTPCE